MRIAWVLYGSLEQRTGGTIYDAEVVERLRRAGDDVHVVSLAAGTVDSTLADRIRAIAPETVVGDELCFRELAIAYPSLGRDVPAPLRVLLVHHLTAWETELAPARRTAVLAEERQAIDASDRIVVTSRATRERLIAEGATEIAIEVVLPGADRLAREHEHEHEHDEECDTRFAFVGSVVPRKRVLELVQAFASGANACGRLTIVGSTTRDEAYAGEVRAAVARLGVGERIVMTGEVDEAGVSRALADADALVMPSSLEGYGIAATEAIHAGVPVIAARAQGLVEALAPCPDATMFADDEESLASALARFATDAAVRASMIHAARAAAPRLPTWAACAEQFRAALLRS